MSNVPSGGVAVLDSLDLFPSPSSPKKRRGPPENSAHPLMLGHAGEHVVCADLLIAGYKAFLASQVCQYDVLVETDFGLLRLQVKATAGPRIQKVDRMRNQTIFGT